MYTPSLIRIIYSNVQIVHTERLTYRQTDRQAGRQTDRQKERKVNHFPCPASGLVPLWNLWSSSKYSVNPFAAPACKSSGLKEPRTCLRNSIFSGPITHLLSVLSVFHVPVRKIRQTGLRVLNFAVVFVVFKWHHRSEGVKYTCTDIPCGGINRWSLTGRCCKVTMSAANKIRADNPNESLKQRTMWNLRKQVWELVSNIIVRKKGPCETFENKSELASQIKVRKKRPCENPQKQVWELASHIYYSTKEKTTRKPSKTGLRVGIT